METTETAAASAPLTSTERSRARRARLKDVALSEVRGIIAHPADHAEIKAYAAKLAKRREREAKRAARAGGQA